MGEGREARVNDVTDNLNFPSFHIFASSHPSFLNWVAVLMVFFWDCGLGLQRGSNSPGMFAISSLGVALNTVNVGHKKPGTRTLVIGIWICSETKTWQKRVLCVKKTVFLH